MDTSSTPDHPAENLYRQRLTIGCQTLDWVPVALEEIFVHLQAHPLEQSRQGAPTLLKTFLTTLALDACQISPRATRAIILGHPGAGKTSLLKHLALVCAQGQAESLGLPADTLPLFIQLDDFAAQQARIKGPYSLLDYFHYQVNQHLGLQLPADFLSRALLAKRCLVCLDGLDKVWQAGMRGAVCDQIEALTSRYPGNRYLVTSRVAGYDQAPLNPNLFDHYGLLPWHPDRIRRFVIRWYTATEQEPDARQAKIDALLSAVRSDPHLGNLAGHPLLLTLMALAHRSESELPRQRVKLYDGWVTSRLGSNQENHRLMERLAYEMHTGAGNSPPPMTIRQNDLEQTLARLALELGSSRNSQTAQDQARTVAGLAQESPGLLVRRGEAAVAFSHPTFQEYLAACDIQQRRFNDGEVALWEEIQDRLHHNHWREIVLLLLGRLSEHPDLSARLARRILTVGEGDQLESVLHRHLFLVAHALADLVQVGAELRQHIIDQLLGLAQRGTAWEQGSALELLSRFKGDPLVAKGLLALARDENMSAQVCQAAVTALGKLNCADASVLDDLLELVYDEQVDIEVRRSATAALKDLSCADEQVLNRLLSLAQDERADAWVRREAAQALNQLGYTRKATHVLLTLAQDNRLDDLVRCVAISSLGELEQADQEVWSGLLILAREEQLSVGIRSDAARVLGQLGVLDRRVLDSLLRMAQDDRGDDLVRGDAIGALGQLGRDDEQVLQSLLRLTQDDAVSTWVRSAAVGSLGQLGCATPQVLAGLQKLAHDERVDLWVRHIADGAFKTLVGENGA